MKNSMGDILNMRQKKKSNVEKGNWATVPDILTAYDAAAFLGVSVKKIYIEARKKSGLPYQRLGRNYAFGKCSFGKYFGII